MKTLVLFDQFLRMRAFCQWGIPSHQPNQHKCFSFATGKLTQTGHWSAKFRSVESSPSFNAVEFRPCGLTAVLNLVSCGGNYKFPVNQFGKLRTAKLHIGHCFAPLKMTICDLDFLRFGGFTLFGFFWGRYFNLVCIKNLSTKRRRIVIGMIKSPLIHV